MGKLKDIKLKQEEEECNWNPSKHKNKECPIHGYESDLTDEEERDIKKAGGLDADKYVDSDEEARRRVEKTERIFQNRINYIVEHPEEYFKKSQIKRIHNYATILEMPVKKFLERVARKMVISRFSPEQAIEWAYKNL